MSAVNILERLPTVAECRISVFTEYISGRGESPSAAFDPQRVPEYWACANSMCGAKDPRAGFAAAIYLGGLVRQLVSEGKTYGEGAWHCQAREIGRGPHCLHGYFYSVEIVYKPT